MFFKSINLNNHLSDLSPVEYCICEILPQIKLIYHEDYLNYNNVEI